jgi:hypothetical protein
MRKWRTLDDRSTYNVPNVDGIDDYYQGPALDHLRCYQVHITKTRGVRIVDTVEFPPSKTAMPQTSSNDLTTIAALELSNALLNPAPAVSFSHIRAAQQLQALRQLSDISTAALPQTATPHSPHNLGTQSILPLCPC